AMNRHDDPQVIYDTNIGLVKKLISACESVSAKPHILFSSSTQEKRDNLYGKSKFDGRRLFEEWADRNNAKFTGLIIPNVFGPFGNPYYNSFIATFCHQLTNGEQPEIQVDGEVKLIYIGELIAEIFEHIIAMQQEDSKETIIDEVRVNYTSKNKVSKVLELLRDFKENYFEKGTIPSIDKAFERNLFNTFLCYINHNAFFPFHLTKHSDDRGSFVETVKLNSGGQVSFSTTVPGITRGNHFHTRKAERFVVIKGKARIELRKIGTDEILSFDLDGENPSFVDMPIWYTHNITNIGKEDLYTIFWIHEHFDPNNPDTYFEQV
ncbi:MAG: NAD-dependent epimerase/dehydratase family protein, partial [Bacteroidales bacterium]|nr:NAD-dependent epimerase/dehydratase family protein [Bacteroidales bacterium]